MIIPYQDLSSDALVNIIKSYVLQEGTDYGHQDIAIETKVEQVKKQLQSGAALILYSELHDNVSIVSKEEFNSLSQQSPTEP